MIGRSRRTLWYGCSRTTYTLIGWVEGGVLYPTIQHSSMQRMMLYGWVRQDDDGDDDVS